MKFLDSKILDDESGSLWIWIVILFIVILITFSVAVFIIKKPNYCFLKNCKSEKL